MAFRADPEWAHRQTLVNLARFPRLNATLLRAITPRTPLDAPVHIGPLTLRSPIGLAAGLDKEGEAIPIWDAIGFGFIEVGTVTAHAQSGNPKPRLFRLVSERGIINRMGFNNEGSQALADRLRALRNTPLWPEAPVGANVGKSKITPLDEAEADYMASIERLHGLVDYFTVNISSPNTPGLRDLQQADRLRRLLTAVVPAAAPHPVLVKLAPDLSPESIPEIVDVIVQSGVTGIIATNTTSSRPHTTGRLEEGGGLSGAPLWPLAKERIGQVLAASNGRIPVIGVGGIESAEQVQELLHAGCAAIQIYSSLIFQGPGLVARLHRDLATLRQGPPPPPPSGSQV